MNPDDAHAVTAVLSDADAGAPAHHAPAPAPPASPSPRYVLGDLIGEGGMGEVVLATDAQIGREVAIKRIRRGYQSTDGEARFLREARIQGRLEHPAIVPVHELSTDVEGHPYFVMKRLAGETLAEVVGRATPGRQRLLRAFVDVCLAIEFAHTRGVVHRDLKPANIMLGDFGEVYVLDWGVARVRDDAPDPARPPIDSASTAPSAGGVTVTGTLLGTPGYMAPEQIRGDEVDARTDVYALGCILFEILTCHPLHPPGHLALQTTVVGIDTRPSRRAPERDIGPELDAIVERACGMEPAERFATARELAERVTAFLDGDRDVAARKQAAAAHLARARDALAAPAAIEDEAARKLAIREASSAFALDPSADEATRLVTRLLLMPPRETPAEVERELAAIDTDTVRRQARLGTGAILGYLAFLPLLYFIGVRDGAYVAAFVALVLACAGATWMITRVAVVGPGVIAAVLLSQVALVVLFARVFSPFLIAPGVAGTTLMAFAQHPRFGRLAVMWGAMTAGVVVPYLLEVGGVLDGTMRFVGDTLVLHSPALLVHATATSIGLCLYVPMMLFVATFFARQNSRAQRDARRLVEIQKWQLRQLMPAA